MTKTAPRMTAKVTAILTAAAATESHAVIFKTTSQFDSADRAGLIERSGEGFALSAAGLAWAATR